MNLTEAAVAQVAKILTEEDDAVALRVILEGGGCSGMMYSFVLEEEIDEADAGNIIIAVGGAVVVVDPFSYNMWLSDATLDFEETLQGSAFVLSTPKSTSCGCGQSFTI